MEPPMGKRLRAGVPAGVSWSPLLRDVPRTESVAISGCRPDAGRPHFPAEPLPLLARIPGVPRSDGRVCRNGVSRTCGRCSTA
eukprot:1117372-Pyramimonas_sp.AAC.1